MSATVDQEPHSSHYSHGAAFSSPCRVEPHPNIVVVDHQAQREKLLTSLRGQTIRIPDLAPLFQHWPSNTSPHIERMRIDIHDWLNSTVPRGKVLDALQASDFGFFGAIWWPHASFEKLQIATYLHVWLFTWDDEIDLNDSTMWNEFGAAQIYRDQTLAYVRYALGIDEACPEVYNRIILNFESIGAALKEAYTLDQRARVYEAMRFFMEMSEQEQRLRLSGAIPSVDEFWQHREGSSAVLVSLAVIEFSWDLTKLPLEFYADSDVRSLLRHTNTIISASNDLLSIEKEIKRGAIDSLIPITFFHVGDIQIAVGDVVAFITAEIRNLDNVAASLLRTYNGADEEIRSQVSAFIDGCKYYCTGNLTWSLATDRYGVKRVDGQVLITL